MSYVITSACIGCKCGRCAEMCPTKAIHEGDMMLFIDPDECVDCEACSWHCERNAIFARQHVPEALVEWIDINAEFAPRLPIRTEEMEPMGFPSWQIDKPLNKKAETFA